LLGLIAFVSGMSAAYAVRLYPMRARAIETIAGLLMVSGIALIGLTAQHTLGVVRLF
jgi:hypothetical protein